ncbi:hormone receptor 4 isoform X1 [Neodiprion pinetum]|uniref:hormone receptor 4 isoform X1 n=2 Tax=Neodiprion pinetum TaxID=441929 RepID=UPI001EDFBDCF|nr:hormone receptor 4 isoform X1 [Neodiprion pinetum]
MCAKMSVLQGRHLGIMTLTSSPCELDNMSLFQDLKLKRRKVDSRCSSDGESAADTSTSSPDNMPGSPGCPVVKVKTECIRSSPSPGTPRDTRDLRDLRGTDTREVTADRASPDSVFPEAASSRGAEERFCTPAASASPVSPLQSHTNVFTSPTPREIHRGETPDRGTNSHYLVQPKEESDNSVFDGGGRGDGSSHPSHRTPSPSVNRIESPSPGTGNPGGGGPAGGCGSGASSGSGLSSCANQQPGPRQRAPTVPSHILAHHQFWSQNRGVQGYDTRLLNGVISSAVNFGQNLSSATGASNEGMKPPAQRVAPATPRPAPSVIMGEVGGVRTMIWSVPPLEPTPTPTASWTATTASSSTSEESAAHVLLNLRSEPRGKPPGTSQSFGPPLNMERLWAGDLSQLPAAQQIQALNLTASSSQPWSRNGNMVTTEAPSQTPSAPSLQPQEHEEEEQPMICMICEDKATGLHYGIITCEGCKGFFKRTVQNRRVYTCVAEGICEITKAQRNRCQYCRFKKCIEQGMVLQAVREDRMPGGRNSGAVYNLYKVKYKKHKKTNKGMNVGVGLGGTGGINGSGSLNATKGTMAPTMLEKHIQAAAAAAQHNQQHGQLAGALMQHHKGSSGPESQNTSQQPASGHQSVQGHQGHAGHLVNGTILKTALTNPSEVVHLRQRLDNAVSSSRDRAFPLDATLAMIQTLIDCDEFQDIATLRNLDELLDHKSDLSEKLCQIGDSIVYKLVQWTKRLPFYLELPVEVHTRLLTHKWHELLVLTTSAYQAIHGQQKWTGVGSDGTSADFTEEVSNNLCTLQTCLTSMMGRPITMDQLRQDVGLMVEKITYVTLMFRQVKLRMEEYVCLKVITMLSQARDGTLELEQIQERYMSCLRSFVEHSAPQQPGRFHDLLVRLPEVQSAAALLLESKMFYVPFLLNSAIQR